MFTGLIEKKGRILANSGKKQSHRLVIAALMEARQIGESIAVNGVCLTVLPSEAGELAFDVSPETLNKTTLADLLPGEEVNLERAMLASSRFGGHYVSGHIDCTAQIKALNTVAEYVEMELTGFGTQAMFYLIPKGSITVDGVSLTINTVKDGAVKLMLVPHTLLHTTLGLLETGKVVNIEFDYLTRIVAHQLQISGKLHCEVEL